MNEKDNGTVFVCKSCGRAIRAFEKPAYCYGCCMTSIENISDEDAKKMELFSKEGHMTFTAGSNVVIEFPGDFKYYPWTGSPVPQLPGIKLSDFQDEIMRRVRQ